MSFEGIDAVPVAEQLKKTFKIKSPVAYRQMLVGCPVVVMEVKFYDIRFQRCYPGFERRLREEVEVSCIEADAEVIGVHFFHEHYQTCGLFFKYVLNGDLYSHCSCLCVQRSPCQKTFFKPEVYI